MEVNLYIETSYKRPNQKEGSYIYILEYKTSKGPATLTDKGNISNMTPREAESEVLNKALGCLTKPCDLTIYSESGFIEGLFSFYIEKWRKNDFLTSKKEKVPQSIVKIAKITENRVVKVVRKADHPYKNWMQREIGNA